MTEPRILLYLCALAYRNPPSGIALRLGHGNIVPVREMCQEILRLHSDGTLSCGALAHWEWDMFSTLMRQETDIIRYVNHNTTTGFVGMAFRDARGQIFAAMRGSETRKNCAPTLIDWADNFSAPFSSSVQYPDAVAFADFFPMENLTIIGHSKGGNNALYALAMTKNPIATAVAFNGQGFPCKFFNAAQKERLRNRGMNYVVANDIVGALLCHPERREFVRGRRNVPPHSPEAYAFDENGFPLPASRTLKSLGIGVSSKLLLPFLSDRLVPHST